MALPRAGAARGDLSPAGRLRGVLPRRDRRGDGERRTPPRRPEDGRPRHPLGRQRHRAVVPRQRPVGACGHRRLLRGPLPARPRRPADRPVPRPPLHLEGRIVSSNDQERLDAFNAHVASGGKVESGDWMPDDYRKAVLKFVEMHANSELMGVLPEREWILRAPSLKRKLALTAKVQDEVGHAQLLYRVAEDLGKTRAEMLADLLAGRTKFHNVFHYPTASWGDVGIIAWLIDAAAIVSQQALRDSSYAPYARTMQKICWEESVHIMHGREVVVTMVNGTPMQRAAIQDALDRWWGPLMQMHGFRTPAERDKDLAWRIKAKANEELRQEFLSIYVPRIREIGLAIPDPNLRYDEVAQRWEYTEPDWEELKRVVTGHGPKSQERLAFRRFNYDETAWVRDVVLGEAAVALAAD